MNLKSSSNVKFWRFSNWKVWLILTVLTLLFFPLFRFVRAQLTKNKEQKADLDKIVIWQENQNPTIAQNKADKITTRKDVQQSAKELAHHLGTMYSDNPDMSWLGVDWSFLNPRGWTENDKKVADILLYQWRNYSYLKRLYHDVYTNSRNLTNDLIKLLDDKELKRVQSKITLN